MFFGKFLWVGSVAFGTLIAVAGLAPIAGAQSPDPAASVADDGSTVPEVKRRATTSRSFQGTGRALRRGEKDDARANPESRLEQEETERRLRNAKPIRATSASERGNRNVTIETIIGTDDRTLVRPTTSFPASATVLIMFGDGGGDFLCSGFMISADTVATAGHCVAPGDGSGFYDRTTYRVFPGRDGPDRPYSVCGARRLYSVGGWLNDGRDDFDYGAIKLKCDIGNTTGWYGFTSDYGGLDNPLRVQGYPGDKPKTQWSSNHRVTAQDSRRVYYRADTTGGMSGSPVWYNKEPGCTRCAIAIHAYGTSGSTPPDSNSNHGTRINSTVFDKLTTWKDAP